MQSQLQARGGETELNDVLTGGASRLVVRFLGMTDIWLVLTWTQFLTFILLGHRQRFLHNANGRATDIPTSRHPNIMCQCVSQSVNVCISQFQISALAPHPTSRLRLLLLFDRPSIYITWARQRPQAQRQEATRLAPSRCIPNSQFQFPIGL